MATKTLYVGDRDLELWRAAGRVAQRRDISVSQLVAAALEDYLPRVLAEPEPENPADRWARIATDEPSAA